MGRARASVVRAHVLGHIVEDQVECILRLADRIER